MRVAFLTIFCYTLFTMNEDDLNRDFEKLEEEQEEKKQGIVSRIFQIALVSLVLAGLVYSSGFYEYFFFQRTPSSVTQELVKTAIDADRVSVPLTIIIITNNEAYGSQRSIEDAERLVENADRVWEQASLDLVIQNIHIIERSDEEIALLYSNPRSFVQHIKEFDRNTINALLVGNLQGLNGVAFGGTPTIAVADYTTVYDFRAFAHEVGHKLMLSHVPIDRSRLMFQGANGSTLSLEEIMRARNSAARFQ